MKELLLELKTLRKARPLHIKGNNPLFIVSF